MAETNFLGIDSTKAAMNLQFDLYLNWTQSEALRELTTISSA